MNTTIRVKISELRRAIEGMTSGPWDASHGPRSTTVAAPSLGGLDLFRVYGYDGRGHDAHGICVLRNHAEALLSLLQACSACPAEDLPRDVQMALHAVRIA